MKGENIGMESIKGSALHAAMKAEAVERMKILRLHPNVIKEFEEKGVLNYSYSVLGFLYWLTEETQERVKEFELNNGCLVYHVIENDTSIGRLITFLYVSVFQDEWEREKLELKTGYALAYVINTDDGLCTEFGGVWLKSINGGVVRIA